MKVLIVEDDAEASDYLAKALRESGHVVDQATDGSQGLTRVRSEHYDALILDRMLPVMDGLSMLEILRKEGDETPTIIVSALGEVDERVRGLRAGGDDYLVKPFSVEQLEARVRAVLRRSASKTTGSEIIVGDLVIDPGARVVTLNNTPLSLSPKEFDLLLYLAERVGVVVSRRQLMAEVWRQPYGGSEKSVDVHVSWIRKKLGESAAEPRYIETVHGVGLKLVEPQ